MAQSKQAAFAWDTLNLGLHLFCCMEMRGDADIFSQRVLAEKQELTGRTNVRSWQVDAKGNDAVPVRYCQTLNYISIIEIWPGDQKLLHLHAHAPSEQCKIRYNFIDSKLGNFTFAEFK